MSDQQEVPVESQPVEQGKQGDCELCGAWCGNLIGGVCAHCRGKFKLD